MALFQRRPQVSDPVNYVTVGLHKTLLIVGLGNIGEEYSQTRHNIGFAAVDAFVAANNLGQWIIKKDQKCLMSEGRLGESKILVMKPTTLMNLSGEAVQAVAHFYKIPPQNICVVHDELDVEFGHIRTRFGGGSAGHNGVKSVTELLSEQNYGRVRIGIGPKQPPEIDSADFVLGRFSLTEQSHLPELLRETNAILSEYAYGGTLATETRSFII